MTSTSLPPPIYEEILPEISDEWRMILAYFRENGLMRCQIESFNNFIVNTSHTCLKSLRPLSIERQDRSGEKKIYTVTFSNLFFETSPQWTDGTQSFVVTPLECLRRNITYGAKCYIDICVKLPTGEFRDHQKVYIGDVPIMVHSNLCTLTPFLSDKKKLIEKGEDLFDHGGYFVLSSKSGDKVAQRKIIAFQEKCTTNKIVVHEKRKVKPAFEFYAEVKSLSPSGIHTTTTVVGVKDNKISVILPRILTPIPLGVVFVALGAKDIDDMTFCILGSNVGVNGTKDVSFITPSLEHAYECCDQDTAFSVIGHQGLKTKVPSPKGADEETTEDDDIYNEAQNSANKATSYAQYIFNNDFLPHLGLGNDPKLYRKKMLFLGYMVKRMIDVAMKRNLKDDRDHYANKRAATTGILLVQQFYTALRKLCTDIANGGAKGSHFDVLALIKPSTLTTIMHGAISNNKWGTLNTNSSSGISQLYDQFCYAASLANGRKLIIPLSNDGAKIFPPRELHPSQWGIACPAETPEGKKVGLNKNAALSAYFTVGCDSRPLVELVRLVGKIIALEKWDREEVSLSFAASRLFINGDLLGFVERPKEFVDELRGYRRKAMISLETSIVYDKLTKEIRINSDGGRICRPLLVVTGGILAHVLKAPFEGKRGKTIDDSPSSTEKSTTETFVPTEEPSWQHLLECGVVELLDKEEEEFCNVAMSAVDFEKLPMSKRVLYSHCEMDPCLIYGIGGSLIPFSNHNQCIFWDEPVLMSDGTTKKIKDVEVGDKVLNFDPENGQIGKTIVVETCHRITQKQMYELEIVDDRMIVATFDHKFFTDRGWMTVEEIEVGTNVFIFGEDEARWGRIGSYSQIVRKTLSQENRIADITTDSPHQSFFCGRGFFGVHNSPRNCYQASMGKQSIGIPFTNFHKMTCGKFHVIDYIQRPIVMTRTATIIGYQHAPASQCAMVAIKMMDYNEEDSITICQTSIDNGFGRTVYYEAFYDEVRMGQQFCVPNQAMCNKFKGNVSKLGDDGIAPTGARIVEGDIIIGKIENCDGMGDPTKKQYNNCSTMYDHLLPATVSNVEYGTSGSGYPYVRVVLAQVRIPIVGDKFSAMHGQKGTCGAIVEKGDLPFDERTGETPDIIVNPLALPSRMTIGMLIEMLTGIVVTSMPQCGILNSCTMKDLVRMLKSRERKAFDKMFAHPFVKGAVDGTPDSNNFSMEVISDALAKLGKRNGDARFRNGITGELEEALIFYGPVQYQRLKHMPIDKVHARARGGRTSIAHQPAIGRRANGGLRFGVQEKDCAAGQGATGFTKDRLVDQSDAFKIWVCECGISPKVDNEAVSKTCDHCGSKNVREMGIPYGTKLMSQELMAMNIVTLLMTKK